MTFWQKLIQWFDAVDNAIKDTINLSELSRVIFTALGAGGTIWTILTALQTSLGNIITDPTLLPLFKELFEFALSKNYIGLAVVVITLLGDFYRRLKQGVDVHPVLPIIKDKYLAK